MIFSETELQGLYVIEPERLEDERGFFARVWCEQEFKENGINTQFVQSNVSFNKYRGTLRGMHYQTAPYEEAKLVRCTAGSLYDVAIDIRLESKTFMQWISVELTANNRRLVYIPEGFANGFLTMEDNTEVFYLMSQFYAPAYARGFRWDDPVFGIEWPMEVRSISDRDRSLPFFEES